MVVSPFYNIPAQFLPFLLLYAFRDLWKERGDFKNLEIASPQSVTATRLDHLVYSTNFYDMIFRHKFY